MFDKVLIANRGAIACRVIRTLRRLGVGSVAVFTEADRDSLHARAATEALALRGNLAAESYLDIPQILAAAHRSGAQAIHPGYGFLSEKPEFAQACESAGFAFIGPTPEQLQTFGLKHVCRDLAKAENVPLLEGSGVLHTAEDALAAAERAGFPVILKASAGGGGIGMQIAREPSHVISLYEQVQRLARGNFGDATVFLEKYVSQARHIEVQIFGDGQGKVIALGERDCSLQRRNQKVIEETPAPGLTAEDRHRLLDAAVRLVQPVHYRSAGTVEFLWDEDARQFYFLEVNARLQVEHGVTEEVTGEDLVEWMVRLAAGEPLDLTPPEPRGHSIQARLYAEDPNKDFQPSAGLVTHFVAPASVRCETWIETGTEVPSFYDPMLAKIIAHAPTRDEAIAKLEAALGELQCHGLETNQAYLRQVLLSPEFQRGQVSTHFLSSFKHLSRTIDVLDGGLETTVQDFPGRIGLWDVGVPPSGPFDGCSFRLGNQLLGNAPDAAGLEMTVRGGKFRFNVETRICLTGANFSAKLDGTALGRYRVHTIPAGATLKLGTVNGPGQRGYLMVEGGFQVPAYLGSKSTFRLGRFGGHGGRALRAGDVLHLPVERGTPGPVESLPDAVRPNLTSEWDLRVVYGPHGAPEFFTPRDMDEFFSASWEVHYNSDRTGVRLIGPKPKWARRDGGEAGLHPSNIHDNAYCVGSIDFTGDMPIILGPDGPSLGGFVCPAVIAMADLWKVGQLKPGDRVRFFAISNTDARDELLRQEASIANLTARTEPPIVGLRRPVGQPVLDTAEAREGRPSVCFRQSGDGVILVEYGDMVLDLDLRFRVQALYDWLKAHPFEGMLELVPGIRSLQVQFDSARVPLRKVLTLIEEGEETLPPAHEMGFASRIVHLPLSWDDPATQEAIRKYTQIVRPDAPWCPSNIEFIRRINGLESIEDVKRIVFDASYFVLGLGDVYLGAPVATPLDPRHRLVTTKYNPARTWTPENAVGIGGAYLCIYGMEGPGGYQFVGRTLPVWNRFHTTKEFRPGVPWLLRFFDQIRWYPVEAEELLDQRRRFLTGQFEIGIEPTTFRVRDYHQFLASNAESIAGFRETQQAAFAAERQRWEESGAMTFVAPETPASQSEEEVEIPEGCEAVTSPVSGSFWKLDAKIGEPIWDDYPMLIVESMKTEISILSPSPGKLVKVLVRPGESIRAGQVIAIFSPDSHVA